MKHMTTVSPPSPRFTDTTVCATHPQLPLHRSLRNSPRSAPSSSSIRSSRVSKSQNRWNRSRSSGLIMFLNTSSNMAPSSPESGGMAYLPGSWYSTLYVSPVTLISNSSS